MDQAKASRMLLEQSQQKQFPYTLKVFGLDIQVVPDVFDPQTFNGWEIFTRNFPSVVGEHVVEIGPGVGITSLYAARHGARYVLALDINPQAVACTSENARRNGQANVEARVSDVFSAIRPDEPLFDTIYWNMPFIHMPESYEYKSMLERSLFDPGYKLTERFLEEGRFFIPRNGRLLVGTGQLVQGLGTGNFGHPEKLLEFAQKHGLGNRLVYKEQSMEVNPVEFLLYEFKIR